MDVYAINFADSSNNPVAKISNLGTILNVIIPLMTLVVALGFLAMLIYGAFSYITSAGNPESMKKAQSVLTSAILGLIIAVSAYVIVKLLGFFFKIDMII